MGTHIEAGCCRRYVAHDVHEFTGEFGRVELPHEPRELRLGIGEVQQEPEILKEHKYL